MKKNKSVVRTNVIYGVLVLVPLAVIVLLLAKIVEVLEKTKFSAASNFEYKGPRLAYGFSSA
jgi:uncharacterized membrane protein